ncbi:MAG: hypothetical protein IIZ12_00315 [Eggerthellaceae bacterium]|nr:hypothetical protein [Eggerthellaceae bacterium]
MAIEVAGKRFVTLADEFFVNGSQVLEAWANGVRVYPDGKPTKLKIITPPDKTSYSVGETMDYTGIVCQLQNDDGSVYTDGTYQTGIVPFSELVFPVIVAPDGQSTIVLDGVDYPFTFTTGTSFDLKNGTYQYTYVATSTVNCVLIEKTVSPSNTYYVLVMSSSEPFTVSRYYGGVPSSPSSPNAVTYDGKTAYVYAPGGFSDVTTDIPIIVNSGSDSLTPYKVGWLMVYEPAPIATIPVEWVSPYDGETLSDSFEISFSSSSSS